MTELNDVTLIRTGYFNITNHKWRHVPRTERAKNNLIFVTKGVLYFEEDGIKYDVWANECLLLEAGKPGMGYKASGEDTAFFFAVFNYEGKVPLKKHFKLNNPVLVNDFYTTLIKHDGFAEYPAFAKDALLKSLLYEVQFCSLTEDEKQNSANSLVDSIKFQIYINKNQCYTVDELANRFHFSRDHISRIFKKHELISLKNFLNSTKISHIEDMLCSPTHSIKDVAKYTGFSNERSMCKFYKYHTGITPTEYRSKYKVKF